MKIQFTFKHMPTSQALADLAEEKLEARIAKFTSRPVHTHVTFSVEGITQKIHVSLITADGFNVEATYNGDEMYAGLDVITEKVESQLRKHKERLKSHGAVGLRSISNRIADRLDQASAAVEDFFNEDAIDAIDILNKETSTPKPLAVSVLNFEKSTSTPLQPVCNG